jgi:hypothetical protein
VGGTTGESEGLIGESEGVIGGLVGISVGEIMGTGASEVDIKAPSAWRYRFQYLSSS